MNRNQSYKLKNSILNYLYSIEGVISVTLVGSFMKNAKHNNFSDIDIVVIAKELNIQIFNKAKKIKNKLNLKQINLSNYKIKTNFTFGPLKFNSKKTIILHVMIYDINSHINHVIQSPFTCYDWERSKIYKGDSLSKICSVRKIQFNDFIKSRRGINDYITDLKNSRISYREYLFKGNKISLIKKYNKLDSRHKIEFSYHIIKNLINNLSKFLNQNNKILNNNEFKMLFYNVCKKDENLWNFYQDIKKIKFHKNTIALNDMNLVNNINFFLNYFKKYLNFINRNKANIYFVRHAQTSLNLNKNYFIGQKLNPRIIMPKNQLTKKKYKKVFSSELVRCTQTARLLSDNKISKYSLLNEINYGKIEGKTLSYVQNNHKKIISAWSKGIDIKFPNGENYKNVIKRLNIFLKILNNDVLPNQNYLIVTHNVILRILLGNILEIQMKKWHLMNIPHLGLLKFNIFEDKIYPEINRKRFIKKINVK